MKTKELVCLAARLADDKKAEDIKVIDLCGLSSLCEFILLVTVTSKPHLDAVEEEISKKLKELGVYKLNRDGRESHLWRVSDYGGFLAHIMTPQAREFYALDKIFSFGKTVDFTKPVKKQAPKRTVTPKSKTTVTKKAKKSTAKKTVKKVATSKATAKKAARKPAAKKTAIKKITKKK